MEENIIYVICSWPLNEEDFKPQVKEIKMEKNSSMDHLTVLNALKKKKNKFGGGKKTLGRKDLPRIDKLLLLNSPYKMKCSKSHTDKIGKTKKIHEKGNTEKA